MEEKQLKEDLETVGQPATEDQVNEVKKTFIKKGLGEEDLNLDNLNSEQLDNLIGKTFSNIQEKVEGIIKYSLKEKLNVADQLHNILDIKIKEAQNIYYDYILERRMKEAENALNLTVKEKEEILNYKEPDEAVSNIGKNVFEIPTVNHSEDLKDQKGEDLKSYKIEDTSK